MGRQNEGIAINGTLPAAYKGTTFNVPVRIIYYDNYPNRPPAVQVIPTPDMVVRGNEFVRDDGTVISALIQRWTPQCNTKLLFDDLIAAFNYKMPVFSKAGNQTPAQPRYNPPPQTGYSQPPPQAGYNQLPQPAYTQPPPPQAGYNQTAYMPPTSFQGQGQPPQPSAYLGAPQPQQTSSVAFQQPLREQYETRASELASELEILDKEKMALVQSAEDIEQARKSYLEEQGMANRRVGAIDSAKEGMRTWVASNSSVDVATLPLDTLLAVENQRSSALLDAMSKEMAYEDAVNALVEAFGQKKCGAEEFVRALKGLYRELFFELQMKDKSLHELKSSSR